MESSSKKVRFADVSQENIESKIYLVTPMNQLINLNQNLTNFDLEVKVTSQNSKPFQVFVADQNTLDSGKIEYATADQGFITINLKNDNNVHQSYFLVLRSDEPCRCQVEIKKQEIPAAIPVKNSSEIKQSINWFKIILVILGILIAGYLIYRFFLKKTDKKDEGEKNKKEDELDDGDKRDIINSSPAHSQTPYHSPQLPESPYSPKFSSSHSPSPVAQSKNDGKNDGKNAAVDNGYTNSLLGRLKKLNV